MDRTGSRDPAVVDFIRQVITARKAEPAYLEQFTKNYQNKLIDANTGRRALTLNDFPPCCCDVSRAAGGANRRKI